MAKHDEEAARDVYDPRTPLPVGFLQDRQIAVSRCEGSHAGQGWDLAELHGIDVFERVEIDDHAFLALRDFVRHEPVPVARAGRPHYVFRLHTHSLQKGKAVLVVIRGDYVFGDAAVPIGTGERSNLDGMKVGPGVDDLALGVFTNLSMLEVADIAGSLEEGARVA
jgi:hypothetical protein